MASIDCRRDDALELPPTALSRRVVFVFIADGGGPPDMKLEKLMPRLLVFGRSVALALATLSEPDDFEDFSTSFLTSRPFSLGVLVDFERLKPAGGDFSFSFFDGGGDTSASSFDLDDFSDFFGAGAAPRNPRMHWSQSLRRQRVPSWLTSSPPEVVSATWVAPHQADQDHPLQSVSSFPWS